MRKIITFSIFILAGLMATAQQDPHFSQYMFNGLVLNPAYAGSRDALSGTYFLRKQWVAMDGSPFSQSVSLHSPLKNKTHSLGGNFIHDQLGVSRSLAVNIDYAYRIPFGDIGALSFGLQGGLTNFSNNLDKIQWDDPSDPAINANTVNMFLPNVGAGIFFKSTKYFAGFSVPELLTNNLINKDVAGDFVARQDRMFLLTGGVVLPISRSIKFRPSFLGKFVVNTPVQFDINASFLFRDVIWLGASYRTQDAVVLNVELQITKFLRLGYAYDINTSKLRSYNKGSHEFMLGFDLGKTNRLKTLKESGKPGLEIDSPRYF